MSWSSVAQSEELNPLREWVPTDQEPRRAGVHPDLGCPMWSVPGWGPPCTDYTLYQQRMYAFHDNGRWSRPKGGGTSISISENT